MLSNKHFKITPRIGEYYLLDKVQGYLTDSVIFQCPTEMGKGILVSKTVHGNIIVGPTALMLKIKMMLEIHKKDLIQLENLQQKYKGC